MTKVIQRQRKLGEFFKFQPPYSGGGHGLELENEASVLLPGRALLGPPVFGEYGFPSFRETPRLRPNKKYYEKPPGDFEIFDHYFLVSQRLRDVLESIDPEGVVFADCDVFYISGKLIEPKHYLCDVVREIDALDENSSQVRISFEPSGRKVYNLVGSKRLIFNKNIVGPAHIFRQKNMPGVICDATLRDACIANGINNQQIFRDVSAL